MPVPAGGFVRRVARSDQTAGAGRRMSEVEVTAKVTQTSHKIAFLIRQRMNGSKSLQVRPQRPLALMEPIVERNKEMLASS